MTIPKVAVVGAGISGLYCAKILSEAFDVTVFESSSAVGGRIQSDCQDGLIMDHGFQVFQPAYPEARRAFNYQKLDLQYFSAGANIRIGRKFFKVVDPFREPTSLFTTLCAPIGTFQDKLRILKLRFVDPDDSILIDKTTLQYLQECGFSSEIIECFFRPFFSGVFLERELNSPAAFFAYLYRLFAVSEVAVPRNGMAELPKQLTNNCQFNIRLNEARDPQSLKGQFDYVVKAFNNWSDGSRKVTTDYFSCDTLQAERPMLYLNAGSADCINHMAPMSKVSSSYCQNGTNLWSVNLLESYYKTEVDKVHQELSEWFPGHKFQHIKRYTISNALPLSPTYGCEPVIIDGVYHCSDGQAQPSIQGALYAARRVAEQIIRQSTGV